MKRAKKVQLPVTTSQRLGSLIKAAGDIMRKGKGLSGDLDRLPMLTWIFCLKFLDDMERLEEQKAALKGSKYRSAIAAPYRWRDWAAKEDGITGDELIAFVNQETAIRPDGKSGPGLFAYLRKLQGASGGDRRDVIAAVFRGTVNRMVNGYLLRDVVNKVSGIHFDSSEEILTLGHLYESMLREMRDAAGDSGEFYTPRPVVRFIVEVMNPRLGETILDPACGTGGFLVEAYRHLEAQCKTVENRRTLQERSLLGGEAKPLPYLLGQMNLLLHGLDYPRIDPGNSLSVKVTEIGDRDRIDVIMTNPPFGGEEERGIQGNFPDDKRDRRDGAALPAAHHEEAQAARARVGDGRPGGGRRAARSPLRRRRGRADQGRPPQELQSPYDRAAAERRLRALHEYPDERPVLRPIGSEFGDLVLRDPASRRQKELHEDDAYAVRGVRTLHRVVDEPRHRRPGMEGRGSRHIEVRRGRPAPLGQPRPKEP